MTLAHRQVRIKESVADCATMRCSQQHPKNHCKFGGRIGHVTHDIRQEIGSDSWTLHKDDQQKCHVCKEPGVNFREMVTIYHHFYVVCFESSGEHTMEDDTMNYHGIFSEDELEEFDVDEIVAQLTSLGVENAKEVVDAIAEEAAEETGKTIRPLS